MLLLNKAAVKKRKPVTREQIRLARAEKLLHLPKKLREKARTMQRNIKTREDLFGHMTQLAYELDRMTPYDWTHKKEGVRTATETILDKKADCLEKAILLRAVFQNLGPLVKRRLGWLVTKNPKGYRGSGLDDIGVHPFVTYKDDGDLYAIDMCTSRLRKAETIASMGRTRMSDREFTAFALGLAGEDLSFTHKKHRQALKTVKRGIKINPNDYVLYCTLGEMHYQLGNDRAAEAAYREAIRIAPDLADPYIAWGNFRFYTYVDKTWAVQAYTQATQRQTQDPHLLRQLERKLYHLGLRSLHKRTKEKKTKSNG